MMAAQGERKVKIPDGVRVWLVFGVAAATLVLVAAYGFCLFVWGFIQNPSAGLTPLAFGLVTMWIPLSIVEFIIASIAQILAYPVLVACAFISFRLVGRPYLPLLLIITPLLALLVWYGYDRIVPDYRWYTDDRPPYEHGLTLERFLKGWAFEAAIVLGYWWPIRKYRLVDQATT